MTNESKTLFIPLYGKAMMSRENFWKDETAEKIVEAYPEMFEKADKSKRLAIYMTMRAKQYDSIAENFISDNPDTVIIHLGCGLDSRCKRVKAQPTMWYDLDFPDVTNLRKSFYTESERYKIFASSVNDLSWLGLVSENENPTLIIAEGLTMYLTEEEIRRLFKAFSEKFKNSIFVFDAYSGFAAKASKIKNPINAVNAKISFAMDDPKIFEENGITCVLNNDVNFH